MWARRCINPTLHVPFLLPLFLHFSPLVSHIIKKAKTVNVSTKRFIKRSPYIVHAPYALIISANWSAFAKIQRQKPLACTFRKLPCTVYQEENIKCVTVSAPTHDKWNLSATWYTLCTREISLSLGNIFFFFKHKAIWTYLLKINVSSELESKGASCP